MRQENEMPNIPLAVALFAVALPLGHAAAQTGQTPATADGTTTRSTAPQAVMRLSKLVGVDVIGLDHTKIGDIEEVLVDRNGDVQAVVIGVGGFLGMGEKSVAVPFDAILWNTGDVSRATSPSASVKPDQAPLPRPSGGAERMPGAQVSTDALQASSERDGGQVNPQTGPVTTGTTERATVPVVRPDEAPAQAMVRLTKAQLEQAPAFRYNGRQ
jgi:sporulation protein YlmC with PRC-barrel domain